MLVRISSSPPRPMVANRQHGAGPGPGAGPSFDSGRGHQSGGGYSSGGSHGGKSTGGTSWMQGGYGYAAGNQYHVIVDLKYDLKGITTQPEPLYPVSIDMLMGTEQSLSTAASPAAATAVKMELSLECPFLSGNENASIFAGQLKTSNRDEVRVIFKSYPADRFHWLSREVQAYGAVARLACVVPRCWALLAPVGREWAGLLLEFAGHQIMGADWGTAPLSAEDRRLLYSALTEVHAAGVIHRDMAPRNVVRRPRGALCIIDFEMSSVGHQCPGKMCPELSTLQRALLSKG
ncbi:hypothetical protein R3P38DRAFT_3113148 [Favolaschia claudopus]|uniref:Protein kinase domain-containing protein n=1 Tax=Favolaschia claudopus TaxID=2862362 RepID=A0AAV9ZHD3_9AGAR